VRQKAACKRGSKSQRKERACQEVRGNMARWVKHRDALGCGKKKGRCVREYKRRPGAVN